MIVELANGKEVISRNAVGNLNFELGGNPTSAFFRTERSLPYPLIIFLYVISF